MEFVRSAIANVINPEAKNADKADKKETKKESEAK
jgi:hypothetical protein